MRNYLERLNAFIAEHDALADWMEFTSRDRSRLLRRAVCAHCGFPRSTLYQNTSVKVRLASLEGDLRRRGFLTCKEDIENVHGSSVLLDLDLKGQVMALNEQLYSAEEKLKACRAYIESFHPSRLAGDLP